MKSERKYKDLLIRGDVIAYFNGHVGRAAVAVYMFEWWFSMVDGGACYKEDDSVGIQLKRMESELPYSPNSIRKWVKELEKMGWVTFTVRSIEEPIFHYFYWEGPDIGYKIPEYEVWQEFQDSVIPELKQLPTLALFDPKTSQYELHRRN